MSVQCLSSFGNVRDIETNVETLIKLVKLKANPVFSRIVSHNFHLEPTANFILYIYTTSMLEKPRLAI